MPRIQKIYVWTNLVRPKPQDITETITLQKSTWLNIWKSWYKIKKMQYDFAITSPSTNFWWAYIQTKNLDISPETTIKAELRTWYYWWSSWVVQPYWWLRNSDNSPYIDSFPSSATSNTAWAYQIIFDENNWEVKVWKTYWTRLYTNSWTFSSSIKSIVSSMFNSSNPWWWLNNESSVSVSKATVTVTYTPA